MRAVTYREHGAPDVLTLTDRELGEPGPGEVRVRVVVSGVNPTDWKRRQGTVTAGQVAAPESVPNQDGAGVVDAVGPGVSDVAVGDRVWLILAAAHGPLAGTAQEYTVLPAEKLVPLPDGVGFDDGAALGIPALTAHRTLTVLDGGPDRLRPGALAGRTVLVSGGAGAVGNATVQLARWAGATVVASVSTDEKAVLAGRAGAHHVLRYTADDFVGAVRSIAPDGVDLIAEVAASANAHRHLDLVRTGGTIAVYGDDRGTGTLALDVLRNIWSNTRYQFVVLYTLGADRLRAGARDVNAAMRDGALGIGTDRGLPVHRFPLADTAAAHRAVQDGVVGKVLVDVTR